MELVVDVVVFELTGLFYCCWSLSLDWSGTLDKALLISCLSECIKSYCRNFGNCSKKRDWWCSEYPQSLYFENGSVHLFSPVSDASLSRDVSVVLSRAITSSIMNGLEA